MNGDVLDQLWVLGRSSDICGMPLFLYHLVAEWGGQLCNLGEAIKFCRNGFQGQRGLGVHALKIVMELNHMGYIYWFVLLLGLSLSYGHQHISLLLEVL